MGPLQRDSKAYVTKLGYFSVTLLIVDFTTSQATTKKACGTELHSSELRLMLSCSLF